MSARIAHQWIELEDRASDGLEVRLWWNRATGGVKVTIDRVHEGARAELHVSPERALDAFHHPFAYVQSRPGSVSRRAAAVAEGR